MDRNMFSDRRNNPLNHMRCTTCQQSSSSFEMTSDMTPLREHFVHASLLEVAGLKELIASPVVSPCPHHPRLSPSSDRLVVSFWASSSRPSVLDAHSLPFSSADTAYNPVVLFQSLLIGLQLLPPSLNFIQTQFQFRIVFPNNPLPFFLFIVELFKWHLSRWVVNTKNKIKTIKYFY